MAFVLEETELAPKEASSKDPRFAHYADSVSVTEGYVMGKAVMAICGELFVPSRDPNKFPICPICKELAEALLLDVGDK